MNSMEDFLKLPIKVLGRKLSSRSAPVASSAVQIIGKKPREIVEHLIKMQKAAFGRERNLVELCLENPKSGIGQHFKRKTWKLGTFYTVTDIKITTDGHHGRVWGVKFALGKNLDPSSKRIRGALKRGVWEPVTENEFKKIREETKQKEDLKKFMENLEKQNSEFAKV